MSEPEREQEKESKYKNLNRDRARSLELVRVLFELPSEYKRPTFQLFVGAAYCLWRAAFMRDAESTWEAMAPGSQKPGELPPQVQLLKAILEDNTVLYPHEKRCRNWFVGFYLNSAELRLRLVITRLRIDPAGHSSLKDFCEHMDHFMNREENGVPHPGWGVPAERFQRCMGVAEYLVKILPEARFGP